MTYYDTDRELLIDDINDMETILGVLEGVTDKPELTDKQVIIAYGRVIYHVLAHAVRIIDSNKRREKMQS